jgi:parallel beta-helix repeat protein
MKEIILVCIAFLFICTCISPAMASTSIIKTYGDSYTITVDDEPGDADYTTIKEAVNHSNPGDTIEVYSGTYYEHETFIEKDDITLKGIPYELGNGSDIGKPFLVGVDSTILYLNGNNTTISGFRMESENDVGAGIGTYKISGCMISDNDIMHTVMGSIYCTKSSYINIINNNLSFSAIRQGIYLDDCSNNIISGNIITDCSTGICILDSKNNIIKYNTIQRCLFGIELYGQKNIVECNHIEDNIYGIQMSGNFNIVKQNNFIDNDKNAILFLDMYTIPFHNRWFNNYWDKPRILPYPIFGTVLFFMPWVQFDWHPALEPYDIPCGDLPAGNQEKQTSHSSQQNSQPITKTKSSTGSICITVKHSQYTTPFSGVCVVAYNLETKDWYYVLPDENEIGVYINNNLPVGEYFIGAGKEGYIIDGTTVTIKENQQTTHTFYLRPEPPNDYPNAEQVVGSAEVKIERFNQQGSSQQSLTSPADQTQNSQLLQQMVRINKQK